MRRKSERTSTSKKTKSSPEKKLEKTKRTRTSRRRKQSSSSDNDSPEETSPVRIAEPVEEVEKKSPTKLQQPITKEDGPEDKPDQVWQVKTSEGSGDTGEIQKLKICLARPSSTPERVDKSPRSKRKHSRTTSSSDTPSEATDDKKKGRHRSKRSVRESKDDSDKNQDSQGDDAEYVEEIVHIVEIEDDLATSTGDDEVPMSTTTDEPKVDITEDTNDVENTIPEKMDNEPIIISEENEKTIDADTTVDSSILDAQEPQSNNEIAQADVQKSNADNQEVHPEIQELQVDSQILPQAPETDIQDMQKGTQDLVVYTEDTIESDDVEPETSSSFQETDNIVRSSIVVPDKEQESNGQNFDIEQELPQTEQVIQQASITEDSAPKIVENNVLQQEASQEVTDNEEVADVTVMESFGDSPKEEEREVKEKKHWRSVSYKERYASVDSSNDSIKESKDTYNKRNSTDSCKEMDAEETYSENKHEDSNSTQSKDDTTQNGQSAPIVISRKRRWGSRPGKITKQKSITISTDILKDIIPDVKPVEFAEVVDHKRKEDSEKIERPILPKIVIDNTEHMDKMKREQQESDNENIKMKESLPLSNRKISIVKENDSVLARPPSPPRHKTSCILFITNLVRPFTLPQLKNLLQRTGKIMEDGFWIDRIKSKCYVKYENEDQAIETRHALHGVTWPVSNPKTLQVDFTSQESFDNAKTNEDKTENQASTIPGTVEDWLREQDMKRERGDMDKPWERKNIVREWDVGKGDKDKERGRRDERPVDKRRHRTPERSPEPAKKFKKKEEEAPAKLLDDLFRKTKITPCIYWLPLSAETIAVKEEQRRQHMMEHERRMQELRRTHRRH